MTSLSFSWNCDSPKCMADNHTEVNSMTVSDDNSLLVYLGKCYKCGHFNKRFTMGFLKIQNQIVRIEHQ